MATESEISDHFQDWQSKGWLWAIFCSHASIYKQTLLFTTFGEAVVWTRSTYISACGRTSNVISNHNTMFSGSSNSVVTLPTLPHHNRSRNSRWRSSKPEVPIFQFVEELETRFQIIIPCFWGREIRWRHSQHCHSTAEVGIQDGRHNNVSYHFRLNWLGYASLLG